MTKCAPYATTRINLFTSISIILIQNNLEHISHPEPTQLYLYGHYNLGKTLHCLVLQVSSTFMTLSAIF